MTVEDKIILAHMIRKVRDSYLQTLVDHYGEHVLKVLVRVCEVGNNTVLELPSDDVDDVVGIVRYGDHL